MSANARNPVEPEPTDRTTGDDPTSPGARPRNVLQFICSTGFYGAEGWILALANNSDRSLVRHHLAVTREWETHDLELSRRYRDLGLPVHELEMAGKFDVRVVRKLLALIREHHIDVIHTHGYKSDLIGIVAARLSGIVSVCTPHGFENARDWKLRAYIRLGSAAFRFFDKVVPLSEELLSDIRGMHVAEERIEYIANGVDLKPIADLRRERESRRRFAPDASPVMGYIGQLIDRKNVRDIIAVFETLGTTMPELRLVILGDGDCRAALEAQARGLICHERIEFRGFVPDPLAHLAEFDLFVMSSSLEGIPRCLMESMAMGVPIVAYDIPGVDQLIEHESTGLLAQPGDIAELTRQCERMLTDEELSRSVSATALTRVHEGFSAKRMADAYLSLFERLMTERSERHDHHPHASSAESRRGATDTVKPLLKRLLRGASMVAISPLLLAYRLACLVGERNACFAGMSQCLSLLPGKSGSYLRTAFYRFSMDRCSANAVISFGTLFSQTNTRIGPGVYIGPQCNIGSSRIEADCLIGSGVHILSGKHQHKLDRLDIPVREQGGVFSTITIEEDTWVGNGAIIMANVGKHCVVGAGAVVTQPVHDYEIVSGNPAAVVRRRDSVSVGRG